MVTAHTSTEGEIGTYIVNDEVRLRLSPSPIARKPHSEILYLPENDHNEVGMAFPVFKGNIHDLRLAHGNPPFQKFDAAYVVKHIECRWSSGRMDPNVTKTCAYMIYPICGSPYLKLLLSRFRSIHSIFVIKRRGVRTVVGSILALAVLHFIYIYLDI